MSAGQHVAAGMERRAELEAHVSCYSNLGWQLVPLRTYADADGKTKQLPSKDWPTATKAPELVDHKGALVSGIGCLLGPSGGVDLDLDHEVVCRLAPRFLRPTATFGRLGRVTHYVYATEAMPHPKNGGPAEQPKRRAFSHDRHGMLVEIRRGPGQQTVVPPTIKPDGSQVSWTTPPSQIATWGVEDEKRAEDLAIATMVALDGPDGARHESRLRWAGELLSRGLSPERVLRILEPACEERGDSDLADVAACIESTRNRIDAGESVQRVEAADRDALDRVLGRTPAATATTQDGRAVSLAYPTNDSGNADCFLDHFGRDWRFCAGIGWLRWDGTRWAPNDGGPWQAMRELAEVRRKTGREMGGESGDALAKWGRASGNASRIKGAIEIARHDPRLAVEAEALDADPMLLNCTNGTVNLRIGELRPHRRDDLITKCTGVAFERDAYPTRFVQFLDEVFAGDSELVIYALRYLATALTGEPPERAFHVWHGSGANGKSVLIETLLHVLGDYGQTLSVGVLLETRGQRSSGGPSPDLYAMRGVRFAACVETDAGQRWNEGTIKRLTGGDRMRCRGLWKEEIEFPASWTIVLATNHKPIVRGTDAAIWDRMHLVPFDVRFDEQARDTRLREKLRAEAPGILWALVVALRQPGAPAVPKRVQAAVAEYRKQMDVVGAFLEECTAVDPGPGVTTSELYTRYSCWAGESGEYVHGKRAFNRIMAERGYEQRKSGVMKWVGVRLRTSSVGRAV